jgi:hypothetical protein
LPKLWARSRHAVYVCHLLRLLSPGASALLCCLTCRYGLLGLLHVIRMTEPDLTMLALGTDLTGLGLNLNSPDPLYKVGWHGPACATCELQGTLSTGHSAAQSLLQNSSGTCMLGR